MLYPWLLAVDVRITLCRRWIGRVACYRLLLLLLSQLLLLHLAFVLIAYGAAGFGKALPVLASLADNRHMFAKTVRPVADGLAPAYHKKH